jgi:uncharacterized membrane protein
MPRQSDQQYLQTHARLRRLWLQANGVYGRILPAKQWHLHAFFQPSKDLTPAELLEHRAKITKERPQLPQHAGKTLAELDQHAVHWALRRVRQPVGAPVAARGGKRQPRNIAVHGVVRPEIDTKKLARALLDIAEQETKHDQADDSLFDDDASLRRKYGKAS